MLPQLPLDSSFFSQRSGVIADFGDDADRRFLIFADSYRFQLDPFC